jgi:hypothetical protein
MLRYVLICGALLCLALPANAQGNDKGYNAGSKPSASKAQQEPSKVTPPDYLASIDIRLGQIARLLDSKIASDESPTEQSRGERDVRAQERMADWGPWMFGIGIAEIVITGLGVWLVRRTILDSRAATEDDIRPYVQLSRAKFQLLPGRFRMIATIQNSGQTPATFFEVHFTSQAIDRDDTTRPIPENLTVRRWNALGGGDTVTVGLYCSEFFKTQTVVSDAQPQKVFHLLGRARYGDIWGNVYETEFDYHVLNVTQTYKEFFAPHNVLKKQYRKMSRSPGTLKTFVLVERAKKTWRGWLAARHRRPSLQRPDTSSGCK